MKLGQYDLTSWHFTGGTGKEVKMKPNKTQAICDICGTVEWKSLTTLAVCEKCQNLKSRQAERERIIEEIEKELDINKTFDSNYHQWQSLKQRIREGIKE